MELRAEDEPVHGFVSPYKELNAGLWSLFLGATGFLGLRIWVKCGYRNYRLWYDDWILVGCWVCASSTEDWLSLFSLLIGFILIRVLLLIVRHHLVPPPCQ